MGSVPVTIRVLAVLAAGAFAGGLATAAEPAESLQIGMIQGMFRDVQPAMVQAMSKPLRDMIRKQTGLTGEVEICPDANALADKMKAKRLHLGVYHGFEFAWLRKANPDLVPLVITIPPARKLQACVVVQRDSKATSVADLKDETVLVPRGSKAHCFLYLDSLRAGLPATTAKPQAKSTLTSEEALDAVINGDSAAALLDASAILGYKNLQPGAFQHLRVLAESPTFPPTVLAYTKGTISDATVAKVRTLLTEANQNAAGRPLLMMWNVKGFEEIPADYEEHLTRIAKEFPEPKPAPAGVARTVGLTKPE